MGRDLQQRPSDAALEIAKFEHQVGLVPEQRHAVKEEPHGEPGQRRWLGKLRAGQGRIGTSLLPQTLLQCRSDGEETPSTTSTPRCDKSKIAPSGERSTISTAQPVFPAAPPPLAMITCRPETT